MSLIHRLLVMLAVCGVVLGVEAQRTKCQTRVHTQGIYFARKSYTTRPLPKYDETRGKLPSPIFDEKPVWVKLYWRSWELAFKNFYEPTPENGFVSQYIDAAFNSNIFLWDTCFLTMFCNVAHPLVPGIGSLDNFYAKQHRDGEICREISRIDGRDFVQWVNREGNPLISRWGWNRKDDGGTLVTYRGRTEPKPLPVLTLDALNHPIFAWAELESYRTTGDLARLKLVYEPLVRYYSALQKYLRQGNGLYVTDWASMDNSTRNSYLKGGGTGVDISCEMVLFARQLSQIARLIGKAEDAKRYAREADELTAIVNREMWDSQRKFYFDLTLEGKRAPVKTVAAYWALLARVASQDQARALADELSNPATFGRLNRVPTLAADEPGYDPNGGYWLGAVWTPTQTMVIRGLEKYGYNDLARQIAIEHLTLVGRVYEKTGTIWENYSPDAVQQGNPSREDFVGWSGLAPILYLMEYAIGLQPDAPKNELVWNLRSDLRCGCERYRFNGRIVSLVAEPGPDGPSYPRITVDSDGAFTLRIIRGLNQKTYKISAGRQTFTFPQ